MVIRADRRCFEIYYIYWYITVVQVYIYTVTYNDDILRLYEKLFTFITNLMYEKRNFAQYNTSENPMKMSEYTTPSHSHSYLLPISQPRYC